MVRFLAIKMIVIYLRELIYPAIDQWILFFKHKCFLTNIIVGFLIA